jgi:hypothetical protein
MAEHMRIDETLIAERDRWYSLAFIGCGPKRYGLPISTNALLLEIDIRTAFRSGAWLAVIVLAAAAIEAQFRQVYKDDYENSASKLYGVSEDLHWLRELRNEILHASKPETESSLWKRPTEGLHASQALLEPEARRAIEVMFRTVYGAQAT